MTSHQPHLSSLVVRPSSGGDDDGDGGGDYEPGEVRSDASPYSRSDRFSDEHEHDIHAGSASQFFQMMSSTVSRRALGYRARSISVSPVRRREIDRRYSPSPEPDHLDGPPRHRPFGGGREAPRSFGHYRGRSGPHFRGRGGRPFGRGFDGPGPGRGEGMHRSISNVRPREGDWFCSHPMCGNLNFARREHCNKCKRPRYPPPVSFRRGYGGPPPLMGPPRRFPGPPMNRSPGRFMNGYRSPPPRSWQRDGPRDFGRGGPPPPRNEGPFPDHHLRRDRLDYPEEDFRDRGKFDRSPPSEWASHDRYERRPLSPRPRTTSLSPSPGRWVDRDIRERSRSPIRGGPPAKDFRRDPYMDREKDERRGVGRGRGRGGRGRMGNVY